MQAILEINEQLYKPTPQQPHIIPSRFSSRDDFRDWEQYLKEFCKIDKNLNIIKSKNIDSW